MSLTACSTVVEDICEKYEKCSMGFKGESSLDGCKERLQSDLETIDAEFGDEARDDLESALGTCSDEDSCEEFDTCTIGLISASVIGNCPDWPSCSGLLD